jgi:hypothetical protein
VPLVGQLRGYSKRALRRDAVAALSVAATLVPQVLAYGQVAGLTPAAGLYTAVRVALAFSLVTSTRLVAVVVEPGMAEQPGHEPDNCLRRRDVGREAVRLADRVERLVTDPPGFPARRPLAPGAA